METTAETTAKLRALIGSLKGEDASVVSRLLERLRTGGADERSLAAWGLWKMGETSREAVAGISEALLKDDTEDVCLCAARALSERPLSPGVAEALARAYARFEKTVGREEVRFWCVRGLCSSGRLSRDFFATLRAAASDGDEAVCLQALLGMDAISDSAGDEALRDVSAGHPNPRVRAEAERRLKARTPVEPVTLDIKAMSEAFCSVKDIAARVDAFSELGRTGDAGDVPGILELLDTEGLSDEVRLAGLRALGEFGCAARDAVAALSRIAVEDHSLDVSAEASRSLQRIRRAMAREVGASLSKARESAAKSVAEAAGDIGVSEDAYARWEKGGEIPDRRYWEKIRERLGPEALELLTTELKRYRRKDPGADMVDG